jgi:hypothetical protein
MELVFADILKQGGAYIISAVLFWLLIKEKEKKDQLADKLYDLGINMTRTNTLMDQNLQRVSKDLDNLRDEVRNLEVQ